MFGKNKSRPLAALLLLTTLILLFFVFVSYNSSTPKLLGKDFVYAIDNLVAQVSLIPKTNRQILVRTTAVNRDLSSYKIDSNLTVGSEKIQVIEIHTSGSTINPAGESQSKSQTKGKVLVPIQAEFDFETYSKEKNFFFKVNKGVDLPGFNTSLVEGWHNLDLAEIEKDLKVDIRTEKEIIADVRGALENYLEAALGEGKMQKKEISQDGKTYFQLETSLKEDPLTKTFLSNPKTSETKVTLTVEKGTYYLMSLQLSPVKKTETNLAFTYKISDHNKVPNFEAPINVKEIKNPVELYLLLTSGAESSAENLLKALGGEVKETATTLLTIERLVKVVLLLLLGL